jgi:hypothetical protein
MSIEESIFKRIDALPRGELFSPGMFYDLGTSESVRLSLFRLEKRGVIGRVAQGIYVLPEVSSIVGKLLLTAEDIAEAISKRDRTRTIPTGSYALYLLGLSTQEPENVELLTDGSPRELRVGNRNIKFKKTTPKILSAEGKISRLVIQAMKEIGNGKMTEEVEQQIIDLLKAEDEQNLRHDIALAPAWIQKIMKKAIS